GQSQLRAAGGRARRRDEHAVRPLDARGRHAARAGASLAGAREARAPRAARAPHEVHGARLRSRDARVFEARLPPVARRRVRRARPGLCRRGRSRQLTSLAKPERTAPKPDGRANGGYAKRVPFRDPASLSLSLSISAGPRTPQRASRSPTRGG